MGHETDVLCGEGERQRWLWKTIDRDDVFSPGDKEKTERKVALSLLSRLTNAGSRDVYRRDINYFMGWWQDDFAALAQDQSRGPITARKPDLDAFLRYLADLDDPEPSPATINRRIAVVSSFYEQACELELRDDNPAKRLKRPKIDNEEARTGLSAIDAGQLMAAAETWDNERESNLVLLLLLHGLRVSEAINLQTKDLQLDGGHFKVMIKRKGMSGKTAVLIDDEILRGRLESARATDDKYVFGDMDRFRAVRTVAAVGRSAQLDPVPHPHILRHTFVAQAIRIGNTIEDVRRMAGHSSIRTTQRYARAIESEDRTIGNDLRRHFEKARSERNSERGGARDTEETSRAS